jgi:hypothetical protein
MWAVLCWDALGMAACGSLHILNFISCLTPAWRPPACPSLPPCSCKFAHPYDQAPKVEFNALGLPLRPGEPECSFYVKNFRQAACGLACAAAWLPACMLACSPACLATAAAVGGQSATLAMCLQSRWQHGLSIHRPTPLTPSTPACPACAGAPLATLANSTTRSCPRGLRYRCTGCSTTCSTPAAAPLCSTQCLGFTSQGAAAALQ